MANARTMLVPPAVEPACTTFMGAPKAANCTEGQGLKKGKSYLSRISIYLSICLYLNRVGSLSKSSAGKRKVCMSTHGSHRQKATGNLILGTFFLQDLEECTSGHCAQPLSCSWFSCRCSCRTDQRYRGTAVTTQQVDPRGGLQLLSVVLCARESPCVIFCRSTVLFEDVALEGLARQCTGWITVMATRVYAPPFISLAVGCHVIRVSTNYVQWDLCCRRRSREERGFSLLWWWVLCTGTIVQWQGVQRFRSEWELLTNF